MVVLSKLVTIPHLSLDLFFPLEELRKEYAEIKDLLLPYQATGPNNKSHMAAAWHGVCLVSKDGDPYSDLHEKFFTEKGESYQPKYTSISELCPAITNVARQLGGDDCFKARIMRVNPGSRLSWHKHVNDTSKLENMTNIVIHVPIYMPEACRYAIISNSDYSFADFANERVRVYDGWYKPGQAHIFNSCHVHNVFNYSPDESKVSIIIVTNLYNKTVAEEISKQVNLYVGDRIKNEVQHPYPPHE